jgi:hypothetical protein
MVVRDLRQRLLRHVNRGELPYRLRGEHHSRLEAFSDAVLAFALTLSVLSLEVPRDSHELLHLFRGVLSFAFTFAVLFGVWVAQNRYFRRFGLEDDRTTWTTGAILFVIVFYTYPLRFVASVQLDGLLGVPTAVMHREDQGLVFLAYGAGYGTLCLLLWSLYRHAWSLRDVLELDEAERLDTRMQMRIWGWSAVLGAAVMSVALLSAPVHGRGPRIALALTAMALILTTSALLLVQVFRARRERTRFLAAARASHEPPAVHRENA